jgi:nitrogen-specific signal transduction histidine kinase
MSSSIPIPPETNIIDADELWRVAWTYIQTVVDTLREPFLILDEDLKVISANRMFYALFQVAPEETEGHLVYDLGNGQWNISKLRILLEDILPKNTFFDDFKVEHTFPRIGYRIMILNARRIYKEGVKEPIMLLAMEDVTKQKLLEDQSKVYTKRLTQEVAKRTAQLESRVKELEKMNKATIARDIRMSDLEAELRELRVRS